EPDWTGPWNSSRLTPRSPDNGLDSVSRRRDVTPDLALKHSNDRPAESFELLVDLLVTCDVAPDLRYPKIGVAVIGELLLHRRKSPLLPAMPMPHVTVNEDSHPSFRKHEIGLAWQL